MGELERLPKPLFGVLSDLLVACEGADKPIACTRCGKLNRMSHHS
jgi:hypothetical protein